MSFLRYEKVSCVLCATFTRTFDIAQKFDDDNSGSLSRTELRILLRELDIYASTKEVVDIINSVDDNHSGK